MTTKRRRRHSPEQVVRKTSGRGCDAERWKTTRRAAFGGNRLEVSEATYLRWRNQIRRDEGRGGRRRLKELHEESGRAMKRSWPSRRWTSRCSSTSRRETGKPFPEACGGPRAASRVRGLRAKGVRGDRPAAKQ